jgi:hypothetical protein
MLNNREFTSNVIRRNMGFSMVVQEFVNRDHETEDYRSDPTAVHSPYFQSDSAP